MCLPSFAAAGTVKQQDLVTVRTKQDLERARAKEQGGTGREGDRET